MTAIRRLQGGARGRSAGTGAGGLVWAVATSDDPMADIRVQTRSVLAKLDRILAGLGSDRRPLLSATVYIDSMAQKAEMDAVWGEWIGDDPAHWPQRACVEAGLHGSDLVEIAVVALGGDGD